MQLLEEAMANDPLLAREQLRALFEGGRLLLEPQADRTYVAVGRIHLGALLTMRFGPLGAEMTKARAPLSWGSGSSAGPDQTWSSHGCAGPQRLLEHAISKGFAVALVA